MSGDPCDLIDVFPTPPEKMFWSDERREQIRRGKVKARLQEAIPDVLLDNRERGGASVIAALIQKTKDIDAEITLESIPRERDIGEGKMKP